MMLKASNVLYRLVYFWCAGSLVNAMLHTLVLGLRIVSAGKKGLMGAL